MFDLSSQRGFDLHRPRTWRGGLILASPHSGRDYPDWFRAQSPLDPCTLRSSEDAFVDHLIAPARGLGAMVLTARVPRAVVDLNRARDDLDPELIEGLDRRPSARSRHGLGVIPRVVGRGQPIHRNPLTRDQAEARLRALWQPYHDMLDQLMTDAMARFGQAVLIDVHSMPHAAVEGMPDPPQMVLGDLWGRSAGGWLREAIIDGAGELGLRTACNTPYAGAYILARHGDPFAGRHAVQIEIDRSLYMDEARITPGRDFAKMVAILGSLWRRIVQSCEMREGGRPAETASSWRS